MKRKSYSFDFKKEVVERALSEGERVSEIAREKGIHPSLINRWIKEFSEGEGPARGPGVSELERENLKLKAELKAYKEKVGELALANDLLKKIHQDREKQQRRSSGSAVTKKNWDPSGGRAE